MSILDVDKVDAMGISKDGKRLVLMLTDHLDWENEADHLFMLQDKINTYLGFIESKQYLETYPDEFEEFVIEIYFKYPISDNCRKLINVANEQLKQDHIEIVVHID